MAADDYIPCDVYQIDFPEWNRMTASLQENLANTLLGTKDFLGEFPSRRGVTGVYRQDNYILGFYLQEDLRYGLEGDHLSSLSQVEAANIEKIFFAFVLDVGHVVIQRTRLSGYVSMSYPSMVNGLQDYFAHLINGAGLQIARLAWSKFYRKRTQDEMRSIFFDNRAVEIRVTDLFGKSVPDTVQLSNPDPKEEEILKRIYKREFETVDDAHLRAAQGQDLRKSKTSKAAISAGDVKQIIILSSADIEETYYETQDERITVHVDDRKKFLTDDEVRSVIEVYSHRIRVFQKTDKPKPTSLGPLFDESNHDDNK